MMLAIRTKFNWSLKKRKMGIINIKIYNNRLNFNKVLGKSMKMPIEKLYNNHMNKDMVIKISKNSHNKSHQANNNHSNINKRKNINNSPKDNSPNNNNK